MGKAPVPLGPGSIGNDGLPVLPSWKPTESTKNFYFDQINKSKVKDTIFIKFGITQDIAKIQLDFDSIQMLFSNSKMVAGPSGTSSEKKEEEKPKIISILPDSNKARNMCKIKDTLFSKYYNVNGISINYYINYNKRFNWHR